MLKRVLIIATAAIILGGAVAGAVIYKSRNNNKNTLTTTSNSNMGMSESSSDYNLNVISGSSYAIAKPLTLQFDVKDKDGNVVKDFATYHEKKMHFIVVRKDRTNFQHVHPTLDEATGIFTLKSFTFPADGDYRLFADFAPDANKKDSMGMIEAVAPYEDVRAGNASKYTPLALGQDSLTSIVNGFTASIVQPPGGDSAASTSATRFYAGQDGSVPVSMKKNGVLFTNLQNFLGSLGHMVVLGPNLEFIYAHPLLDDVANQTGYIQFMVTFPTSGQYKLYLQTQADNQVTTNDFNLTVQDKPASNSSNDGMSGMDMSH